MKKLLLATTFLAGTAGVAAAEVSFSGNAYIGISNNWDNEVTATSVLADTYSDFEFVTRVRFAVSMSGETDSGLTFGAGFDSQNAANAGSTGNSDSQGSATAYIAGSFGKVTFGDVGSAPDNLIGNVSGVGMNLDGHNYHELGYVGNDKTAVKYEGTFGDFSVTAAVGQLDANNSGTDDQDYSIAFKYSFGDYAVYAGYEEGNAAGVSTDQTTIGADATFGNFTVKARVADNSAVPGTMWALSASGKFDAITVTAYYADHDSYEAFGLGASYDLGGGASFVGGIAQADYATAPVLCTIVAPATECAQGATEEMVIDLGLKFSF
jgi:outer membrane protein OmpU